jgi:hypothetical protein
MVCDGGDCSIVICKWVGGWWCSASASASVSESESISVSVSTSVGGVTTITIILPAMLSVMPT